ncbi:MAG: glycosyltransferase [Bacteroidales bacterium]|nr:glycosyltransferase [Bacteroidales bacterium]MBO7763357.1 glycosyltransferase [Bacteroidales bacterium]
MKVLIISDAQSVHTQRWVSSLSEKGVEVVLYSIKPFLDDFYSSRGIKCHFFDLFSYKRDGSGIVGAVKRHFQAVRHLKKVLRDVKPDILHAHYVTSYSLIAAMSGFHPLIVSLWGSDIYIFPRQLKVNKFIVKYTLRKADKILSTSHVMAKEAAKYTRKKIDITPFGVDTELFHRSVPPPRDKFVIGSVKTLSYKYGTEYLIRAFKEVCDNNPKLNCCLELVGKGPDERKLKHLADQLGISDKVIFAGYIRNDILPRIFDRFSIACYMSLSESFGVSAIEAMACNCPVVTSDADGFTEVVENGVTGIIVPRCDYHAAARAIQTFIDDPSKIVTMGVAGRERVAGLYQWSDNVDTMISMYKSVL